MPVAKYKSVIDLPPPPPRVPLDPANLTIVFELSAMCMRLSGRHPRPGLYKNRSLAEAEARAADWDRDPSG